MSREHPVFGETFDWGRPGKPDRRIMYIAPATEFSAWIGMVIEVFDFEFNYRVGETKKWAPLDRRAKPDLPGWMEVDL